MMKSETSDPFVTKVAKLQEEVAALEKSVLIAEATHNTQIIVAFCIIFIIAFLLFSISPSIVESSTGTSNRRGVKQTKFSWFKFILWTIILSTVVNGALYFSHTRGYINFS